MTNPEANRIHARGFNFYRGAEKWLVKGVTYGPFRPRLDGSQFPESESLARDLDMIAACGVNVIRVYTTPPRDLLEEARTRGIHLLVDIPWPKHISVYGDAGLESMCLKMVEEGVVEAGRWDNVLGIILGNEIPPDIARWAKPREVELFLRRMYDHAKSLAPDLLVGFANYPSTEFLRLHFFDFLGFNVYLEKEEELKGYIHRLRHLYPETPLILSETGLDSLSNGEEEQARVLEFSLRAAYRAGMAGALVFSWTDEWHTGGYDINDWGFGLVTSDRRPKPALEVANKIFQSAPQVGTLRDMPRVSVVVATYNGGKTLHNCLESLARLKYDDYEVIVVDDGSSDNTGEILAKHPNIRLHRQENKGLSNARNMGISMATGEIVAFTDSDCVVDPDWIYFIVDAMMSRSCAGVGGPNLTPWESRPIHRTVAYAPGHATHVLLDSHTAEHVPGCNMAFWKSDLVAAGCFDPVFRKAGDDVDMIWRLQDQGEQILFAPAAFVWHHRRSTIGAYLAQQKGYGEAEALLARKHPQRFNDRGQSLWRGVIYSGQELLPLMKPYDIHYGVFGSAGFQCIYERRSGFLPHLLTSFEWWVFSSILLVAGLYSHAALLAGCVAVTLSLGLTFLKARRNFATSKGLTKAYFPVVWLLWILQPVVRGYKRYIGLFTQPPPSATFQEELSKSGPLPSLQRRTHIVRQYWNQVGVDRLKLITGMVDEMSRKGWLFAPNSGWEPWDFTIILSQWYRTKITTVDEDHGDGRHLFRIRYQLSPTSLLIFVAISSILLCLLVGMRDTVTARILAVGILLCLWASFWFASRSQAYVLGVFEGFLAENGYFPMKSHLVEKETKTPTTMQNETPLT
jgi:O-antigen biosynthesis protein